jgi:hypothetical protein
MTDTGSPTRHTIAGTVPTMPVRIRKADTHVAMFSVSAPAAQRMIDYSGLRVCDYLPGSTARGPRALGSAAAFIHHLPVNQSFTLEAGQRIWGFPKVMADFTVRETPKFDFDVTIDGQLVAGIEFGRGVRLPAAFTSRPQVLTAYSHTGGVSRKIIWEMRNSGMRARLGGARLRLGDHPYAQELAALGLPKRAFASQSSANVEMTFGDAQQLQ